jgi:UrcA family protein
MTMKNTNVSARSRFGVHTFTFATLALSCLAGAATTVRAAEVSADSVPTKTVTYRDLNLGNSEGIEQLYRRIVAAAQQVCNELNGRSLAEKRQFSICTGESIAHAVATVDQPALTALQALKTGQPEVNAKLAKR